MRRGRGKIIAAVVGVLVVIVLIVGIVAVVNQLRGNSTFVADGVEANTQEENTADETADNSIPMTSLSVTAPDTTIRVGETMQLSISYEPADATNPTLTWSCDGGDFISVTEDGVLTPSGDSGEHTVTVTAEASDGSGLSQSFDLRIYPAIDPSKPMVAITFDDGPNENTTGQMLDALEENYAKATFFCVGYNVEKYPDMVRREEELGMEVGAHSYGHVQLTTLSGKELKSEIKDCVTAIKDITGKKPTLLRPPYGSTNDEVMEELEKEGLCAMNWSLDTEDWVTKNADDTYKMVMTCTDGDVVLLHDIHDYNIEAVKRFVPDLIEQGFQLVTVSELYEARGETLDPGTTHFRTDPTTEETEETAPAQDTDGSGSTDADGSGNTDADSGGER